MEREKDDTKGCRDRVEHSVLIEGTGCLRSAGEKGELNGLGAIFD